MKTIKILILIISLAMINLPAFAQKQMPGPPPDDRRREEGEFTPDPGQDNPPSEERREEIRKKIEAIRIWRLTEELKLDANAAAKLSSVLSSFDQQRRDIMREQMMIMRDLRFFLKSSRPDEPKLKASLEMLEKNHRGMQELREKELRALKDILTIEQQARFLLFQQEFQREMRGMIAGARSGQEPGMRGNRGQGRGGIVPGPGRPPQY